MTGHAEDSGPTLRLERAHIPEREPLEDLVHKLLGALARRPPLKRIAVKSEGLVRFVQVEQVHWVESNHNYVRLHTTEGVFALRMTLGDLAARLDPDQFIRVRRGVIVNVSAIAAIESAGARRQVVVLHDATRIVAPRGTRRALRKLVSNES